MKTIHLVISFLVLLGVFQIILVSWWHGGTTTIHTTFYTPPEPPKLPNGPTLAKVPKSPPVTKPPRAPPCPSTPSIACLGPDELAALKEVVSASGDQGLPYFTGCSPGDTTPQPWIREHQYRVVPPEWKHIGFQFELLNNAPKGTREDRGIFGAVVVARDHKTNSTVALKVTSPRGKSDPSHSSQKEMEMYELLSRKGSEKQKIVQYRGHGTYLSHNYLIFSTLSKQIHKMLVFHCTHGVSLPWLKRFAKNILTTLSWLHGAGVSHNDLYYHNILFKEFDVTNLDPHNIHLIDFGRATEKGQWGKPQGPGATPFLAPEIWLKTDQWGDKSDIWSLGELLLFLHTAVFAPHPGFLTKGGGWRTAITRHGVLLGAAPPESLLRRSKRKVAGLKLAESRGGTVESRAASLKEFYSFRFGSGPKGQEEVKLFLEFVAGLLDYEPNSRPSAEQALCHPWLKDVPGPGEDTAGFEACTRGDGKGCICEPKDPDWPGRGKLKGVDLYQWRMTQELAQLRAKWG